jgi:predicted aconitase with swiveling domain
MGNTQFSIDGKTDEPGVARGEPFLLQAPLSFWGGFDSARGVIIEQGHPDAGASLAGRVLLMERAKGSSSSSSVLAEALRNGTGPCALVMRESDLIIALGAIVARELYGIAMPIVVLDDRAWKRVCAARGAISVNADAAGKATLEWSET